MEVPDSAWEQFVGWFSSFGNGPTGLMALAMVLLAVVAIVCLPKMWKDYLEYRTSGKELEAKAKELDILLVEKVTRLAEHGDEIKIVKQLPSAPERPEKKKERKK